MTFHNDLITETIKIYLWTNAHCPGSNAGAARGVNKERGTLGSSVVNACFFPQWPALLPSCPPICDSLWFVGGLSAALSQRTPWNFWIILHCLFTKRRVGEVEGNQGQGQGEGQGQRKRLGKACVRMSENCCVRCKLSALTPVAKQNE